MEKQITVEKKTIHSKDVMAKIVPLNAYIFVYIMIKLPKPASAVN